MPLPWPGKKDAPPGVKPEFPTSLEADVPGAKAENPLNTVARDVSPPPASGRPASERADSLPALAESRGVPGGEFRGRMT